MAESKHGFSFPHRHNYYMLMLATAGSGRQLIDFETYDVTPGQLYLMSPGMIHAWEENNALKGFDLFFTADFFTQRYNINKLYEFPFFSLPQRQQPMVELNEKEHRQINELFEQMLEAYESGLQDGLMSMLRSYLNIILVRAQRIYTKGQPLQREDSPSRNLIQQFELLIEQHHREYRLVKDYGKLLHITPNHLNAVCREKTGRSAGDLIRNRIMLEAKRMLAHDRRTVGEIGSSLNFNDTAYFCRFFKKYEGATPEQFRRQLLQPRTAPK